MQNTKRKVLWAESGGDATLKRRVEEKQAAEQEVEKSNIWRRSRREWRPEIYSIYFKFHKNLK